MKNTEYRKYIMRMLECIDDQFDLKQIYTIVRHKFLKTDKLPVAESNDRMCWIPVDERFPEDDDFILLSFENFNIPLVGRYESDTEGGGKFYVGDDEESCISVDLFVNAWMPLPEPYKG